MRYLLYTNAEAIDLADHDPDRRHREPTRELADLLTPISKAWSHRPRRRGHVARHRRCTAAWATSRRPASRSTTATPASHRSTRAPTASRPSTSSAASCRCAAARSSPSTSPLDEVAATRRGAGRRARRRSSRTARRRARVRCETPPMAAATRRHRSDRRARRGDAVPADVRAGHRRLAARPRGARGQRQQHHER